MSDKSYNHPGLDELDTPTPPSRFLSNGRLVVHITGAGTGLTSYSGYNLNRWRGDPIEDRDGFFVYLRDLESRHVWSPTHQPTCLASRSSAVDWHPGVVQFTREIDGIEARIEICVPSEVDVDLRRIMLRNRTAIARRIEVTTFAEVALNDPATHEAHPGFSRLFVETEFVSDRRAILVRRRPRSNTESHPWMFHGFLDDVEAEHDTDRGRFLGRGHDASNPRALNVVEALSGTTGNVLDPAVSLRSVIDLGPGATTGFACALGAADGREPALASLNSLTDHLRVDQAFEGARVREEELISRHGLNRESAAYFQALAGAILFGDPALRAAPEIIARAEGPLTDLDTLGISTCRHLVVLHAERPSAARLLPDLLGALRYWQAIGLPIDLLVLVDVSSDVHTLEEFEVEGTACLSLDTAKLSRANLDRIDAVARLVILDALPDLRATSGAVRVEP